MLFLFPYEIPTIINSPDWRSGRVISFGYASDRVKKNEPGHFTWWGMISIPYPEERVYPLHLEYMTPAKRIGNNFFFLVATPPGRPGNIATILIDRDGNVVPDINFPAGSRIRVWPLHRGWKSFGWNLIYPAIGLQFLDGVCTRSKSKIQRHQDNMMRNQA